jgi:RNA polymerase sigma-54 factor
MSKLSLKLKLGQQLTMTPQLQQAIRLLQMPVLELNAQLQEVLETNIMLELEEPADANSAPDEPRVEAFDSPEAGSWEELMPVGQRPDAWSQYESFQAEIPDRNDESLKEHLLWQLEMDHFSPREVVIGQTIVDYLNDDGYLTESLENIQKALADEANFSIEEIESTLVKIQAMDPVGIGARDLSECISLQLAQLNFSGPSRDLALQIAKSSLDLVAEHEYAILRRRFGVSETQLDTALALIRASHPRPGSAIEGSAPEYVIPDVYVRNQDDRWIVDLNRAVAPQLRVNQAYADLLRGNRMHATLRSQLQEARWLVRSLAIRHDTLLKVALCIVKRQVEFLKHGEEAMRPMVLRDIAEAVQLHESTISRVTSNKYMHTPRGVIEFRYFFSSQLKGKDGPERSSTAIRARIRRLIGKENPQKPLSDIKIAAFLEKEGTKVARRTVAKYRESMKIPPSRERKHRPVR